jgi:hypothetical protein
MPSAKPMMASWTYFHLADHFFELDPGMPYELQNVILQELDAGCRIPSGFGSPKGAGFDSAGYPASRFYAASTPTRFQALCAGNAAFLRISQCQFKQTPCYPAASKPLTSNY